MPRDLNDPVIQRGLEYALDSCPDCGSLMLAPAYWYEGKYPKYKCGLISFNSGGYSSSRSLRCQIKGLFRKKVTFVEELDMRLRELEHMEKEQEKQS